MKKLTLTALAVLLVSMLAVTTSFAHAPKDGGEKAEFTNNVDEALQSNETIVRDQLKNIGITEQGYVKVLTATEAMIDNETYRNNLKSLWNEKSYEEFAIALKRETDLEAYKNVLKDLGFKNISKITLLSITENSIIDKLNEALQNDINNNNPINLSHAAMKDLLTAK